MQMQVKVLTVEISPKKCLLFEHFSNAQFVYRKDAQRPLFSILDLLRKWKDYVLLDLKLQKQSWFLSFELDVPKVLVFEQLSSAS